MTAIENVVIWRFLTGICGIIGAFYKEGKESCKM